MTKSINLKTTLATLLTTASKAKKRAETKRVSTREPDVPIPKTEHQLPPPKAKVAAP